MTGWFKSWGMWMLAAAVVGGTIWALMVVPFEPLEENIPEENESVIEFGDTVIPAGMMIPIISVPAWLGMLVFCAVRKRRGRE